MERFPVELTQKQKDQFQKYYEMLIDRNKVMNLTAITEYDEVVEKHFIDSISLYKAYELEPYFSHPQTGADSYAECKVIDLGTGAGFPGIPLKIVYPGLKITLLDSLNKRVKFLNDVISELGLTDIEAIHGRAEDFAKQPEYREQYDLCVSRAVANLATLSEYCLPYVKKGGYFISYKSGNIDEELSQSKKAIGVLGGSVEEVVKFNLLNSDVGRSFVKIQKISNTPKKYPRKAGVPGKEPIK